MLDIPQVKTLQYNEYCQQFSLATGAIIPFLNKRCYYESTFKDKEYLAQAGDSLAALWNTLRDSGLASSGAEKAK